MITSMEPIYSKKLYTKGNQPLLQDLISNYKPH